MAPAKGVLPAIRYSYASALKDFNLMRDEEHSTLNGRIDADRSA